MSHGTERSYVLLKRQLMAWVWNNPRLLHKITKRNLEHLFELDPQRGLSIDLRRFEPDYYREVFYPPDEKKQHIDEFVRKICQVIHQNLHDVGKTDMTITITVRHMISEISHWKTFYIDQNYACDKARPLTEKEQDWHYSFNHEQKRA